MAGKSEILRLVRFELFWSRWFRETFGTFDCNLVHKYLDYILSADGHVARVMELAGCRQV